METLSESGDIRVTAFNKIRGELGGQWLVLTLVKDRRCYQEHTLEQKLW